MTQSLLLYLETISIPTISVIILPVIYFEYIHVLTAVHSLQWLSIVDSKQILLSKLKWETDYLMNKYMTRYFTFLAAFFGFFGCFFAI